jgi:hypothetical protein
MHCPQCGQQQNPGEVRFCSRCGFPLGGVSELMAHGGMLPAYVPETEPQGISPRRKGVKQGVTLIMLGIITTILFGILNSYTGTPEMLTALAAVIGFVGGPLRVLYALIFEEGAPPRHAALPTYMSPQMHASLNAPPRQTALPPAHSMPVPPYAQRQHTSEIVKPPSVTEGTTRLLEKDPNNPER